MTEVSQSPKAITPRIDSTWHNATSLEVLAKVERKSGKELPTRFREVATQVSVRHILERGSIAAEEYYERHSTERISASKLAEIIGLNRVTLRRWIKEGKGNVDPLLYFAIFVSENDNELEEWTNGSIEESVLSLIDEVQKAFLSDANSQIQPDRVTIRFMAFCFCQPRSCIRLLDRRGDRDAAIEEYLDVFLKHDDIEIQKHRKHLTKALEKYCYLALAVLSSIPSRALNHVLRG